MVPEIQNDSNIPTKPYKGQEFKEFLGILRKEDYRYWHEIAHVLGVDRKTIHRWKENNQAKKIMSEEIREALDNMKRVGLRDWRMWRERIKLLGLNLVEGEEDLTRPLPTPILSGFSEEDKLVIVKSNCEHLESKTKKNI